jgi:hypothetical protein
MDMNKIPMSKVIEVELDTGFLLYEIFDEGTEEKPKKQNPWAKLVFAYLAALSADKVVTWQEMKNMGQQKIDELVGEEVDFEDPKDVSELNN